MLKSILMNLCMIFMHIKFLILFYFLFLFTVTSLTPPLQTHHTLSITTTSTTLHLLIVGQKAHFDLYTNYKVRTIISQTPTGGATRLSIVVTSGGVGLTPVLPPTWFQTDSTWRSVGAPDTGLPLITSCQVHPTYHHPSTIHKHIQGLKA